MDVLSAYMYGAMRQANGGFQGVAYVCAYLRVCVCVCISLSLSVCVCLCLCVCVWLMGIFKV